MCYERSMLCQSKEAAAMLLEFWSDDRMSEYATLHIASYPLGFKASWMRDSDKYLLHVYEIKQPLDYLGYEVI